MVVISSWSLSCLVQRDLYQDAITNRNVAVAIDMFLSNISTQHLFSILDQKLGLKLLDIFLQTYSSIY